MSQFFDQYNAILEKSLQRVRLKVDPSNKCAEDFAQFDGYVGYILAETDDSIEFFYDNQTVTIPKNVIVVENAFTQGAINGMQGLAGKPNAAGFMGAAGAITRQGIGAGVNALKGAANFGSMLYTGQKLFDGSGSGTKSQFQGAASQAVAPRPPGVQPLPASIDRKQSYMVQDVRGVGAFNGGDVAVINFGGKFYAIAAIDVFDNNPIVAESFADVVYSQQLYLETLSSPPALPPQPAPAQPAPAQPAQPAPAQPAPAPKALTTQKINANAQRVFNKQCKVTLYDNNPTSTKAKASAAVAAAYQDMGIFSKVGNVIYYTPLQK